MKPPKARKQAHAFLAGARVQTRRLISQSQAIARQPREVGLAEDQEETLREVRLMMHELRVALYWLEKFETAIAAGDEAPGAPIGWLRRA